MTEPLIKTSDIYNPNKNITKIEFLQDPAVLTDYNINLSFELIHQYLAALSKAIGFIAFEGMQITTGSNGHIYITAGKSIYRNWVISTQSQELTLNIPTQFDTNSKVFLRITEDRFTSGSEPNLDYGGFDPVIDVKLSTPTLSFDTHNEYRIKYEFFTAGENYFPVTFKSGYSYKTEVDLATIKVSVGGATTIINNNLNVDNSINLGNLISETHLKNVAFKDQYNIFTMLQVSKHTGKKIYAENE